MADKRLQELAAIAQLYTGLQAPQQREAENRQQNALAILGLLMQQQAQQQENEAREKVAQRNEGLAAYQTAASTPGFDPMQAMKFLSSDLQPVVKGIHQENVKREVAKHQGALGPITDSGMRDQYLGSINVHPDVMQALRVAVPSAQASAETQRSGGLLPGIANFILDPNTLFGADYAAKQKAKTQQTADSVWNFLFGKPVTR